MPGLWQNYQLLAKDVPGYANGLLTVARPAEVARLHQALIAEVTQPRQVALRWPHHLSLLKRLCKKLG